MGKTAHGIKNHLQFERTYNCKKNQLFEAWIKPESLAQWWGPHDYTNPVCELDVSEGGQIEILMRDGDGNVSQVSGTYHEIEEPDKLVFTTSVFDKLNERLYDAIYTVNFSQQNGNTLLTLDLVLKNIEEGSEKHLMELEDGWNQSLERLNVFMIRF